MPNTSQMHKKGLLIAFTGAMFLTFDTLLIRLINGDQWTVMFWRSVFVFVAMTGWWSLRKAMKKPVAPLINGAAGLITGLLYGIGGITFLSALYYTPVANVVFLLALNPLFAALLSVFWLKEKIAIQTWVALIVCFGAVALIVRDGLGNGTIFGDLLAISTSFTLGLALTISRRTGRDLSLSPAIGAVLTASVAPLFIDSYALSAEQWFWMSLNGIFVMALASALLALAPKYISAAEVAMFFLLETVLAPLWVWLVTGEKTTLAGLAGGAIILLTLGLHSLFRLHRI